MKTIGFSLAALVLSAAPALANTPQPSTLDSNYSTDQFSFAVYGFGAPRDTPTMARQRLANALQLRDEAARRLEASGGVMTPEYRAFVNRRAREILGAR